ncbi:sulfite exporter TauE/SafE family protein [Gordonia sp. CPCC 205333]|uniref:sulfite exporter TauE/SafE family protein n=1 Tax=Gordonia sp. CPCC 205333 TaxID=3140790 RepID=UPI003AF398E2
MSLWQLIIVGLAGVAAGAINAVVGSGTLVTFPTLVAFGMPAVNATMSNAVGLVAGGVSGTWGYRNELAGQWSQLRWQIPASFVGALVGCWLLLHLPESVFERIVPVLLVVALTLVVAQPGIQRWAAKRSGVDTVEDFDGTRLTVSRVSILAVATFAVGVYGGYFTAAQGILLIAAMGVIVPGDLQRMNAAKNLLALIVNVVAAVTYTIVAFDRIDWAVAGLIAVGSLFGGMIGARYGRRLTPGVLRAAIVVVGLIGLWRLLTT